MLIYGTRLFGKTDAVPGLGHVATRFFHIDYLPLIPVGSFLIMSKSGKSFRGVPIPLSFKSILLAWVRVAAVVAGLLGLVGLFTSLLAHFDGRGGLMALGPPVALSVFGWGLLIYSMKHRTATRASYRRACELGRLIKLGPDGLVSLARAYDQAPPTFGFEPLPVTPRAVAVEPMMPLEVIDADGEDGEDESDAPPANPKAAPFPATTVTPITPKAGY